MPLLWPALPPLTDLPGHVGRYRVMLEAGQPPLDAWYGFHWAPVGNLGCDLLVLALAPILGLEPAVKLIAIGIAAGTAIAMLALSRAAHGRASPFALLALPLVWSQPFNTGFLNFCLAMALALAATALWLRRAPGAWWAWVPLSLLLWTAHVFGWAVFVLLAGAIARRRAIEGGARQAAALVATLRATWPLAAPLVPMLAWRARGADTATFGFLDLQAKALAILMALRDRWFGWDAGALILLLAVLAWAIRSRRVTWNPALRDGALLLWVAFLALPAWLMGSAFADMRLAPYALAVTLIALRPTVARTGQAIAAIGLALLLARTGGTTISLARFDAEQRRATALLDLVPPGARVASLVTPSCDHRWRLSRSDHLGGLVIARRRGFSNDQWAVPGGQLLRIDYPPAGAFDRNPSQLLRCPQDVPKPLATALAALPRRAFDYVWLIDLPAPPPATIPGMTRLRASGRHALYRIDR